MIVTFKGVFTPEQCDELVNSLAPEATPWRPTLRKRISTIAIPKDFTWFHEGLNRTIESVNSKYYQMEINGLTDDPAFVRYDERGHFGWHHDMYTGREKVHRKFSLICILSKPGSHKGGQLQFFDHGLQMVEFPNQGTIITFPAWTQHQVTQITSGNRYSAVAFVGGPTKFR